MVRRVLPWFVVLILFAALAACAARTRPTAPGAASDPRASWVIRAGGEYGSEREICRSDRGGVCVIPAAFGTRPTNVVVSVFLYPAGNEATTYKGAFMAGFMGSAGRGHETKVDYSIKPGQQPSFVSSSGRISAKPGDYEFRMALFAEVSGRRDPHQFQQTIPIRVVAQRAQAG